MNIPTVNIFGVSVSKLGMDQTVTYLTNSINKRVVHQVVTVNPIIIMAALQNPEFMAVLKQCELIVPDGTGVVWAAEYFGSPVQERVPGIDLLHRLMIEGQKHQWKVYLVGASPEVIQTTEQVLQKRYPGIQIVGARDGFFTSNEDDEVIADIVSKEPDILLVGRSTDLQDPWIGKYKSRLNVPLMMGVGGSFDVISGKIRRAPIIFQKLRIEWLHRLILEPSRYKRMLALPKFAVKVIREKDKVQKYE